MDPEITISREAYKSIIIVCICLKVEKWKILNPNQNSRVENYKKRWKIHNGLIVD